MDDKLEKIIKERFEALPESIQEIILSSNYEDKLLEVSKKYNLNVEQMGKLELQTTMILMGLGHPDNFQAELTKDLDIDAEKVRQIVKEINDGIFAKIRELLKLMNTPPGEEPRLDDEVPAPSTEILKAAGVSAPAPDLSKPELPSGILAQKFSGSFQIPSTKTEYTIPGVSSTPAEKQEPPAPQQTYPPKADPYREPPE